MSSAKTYEWLRTPAMRERLQLGARLAKQLPVLMGASECAAKLGISTTLLRRTECLALAKIHAKLNDFLIQEKLTL